MNDQAMAFANHEILRVLEHEIDMMLASARTNAFEANQSNHPEIKAYLTGACNATLSTAQSIAERHGITIEEWKIKAATI